MKNTLSLMVLLFAAKFIFAQNQEEFQIRVGYGLAGYKTGLHFSYKENNTKLSFDTTDGAATSHLPIELRYQFKNRFNVGLDMKFGKYLYAPEDKGNKSNKFSIIGYSSEFNLVNVESTRVYLGLNVNRGSLEMKEKKFDFAGEYTETAKWSGAGFKLNLGICHFINDGPIGLNFNLGYDQHKFYLRSISRDGTDYDLSNFEGYIKLGGIEANVGLIVRIKT